MISTSFIVKKRSCPYLVSFKCNDFFQVLVSLYEGHTIHGSVSYNIYLCMHAPICRYLTDIPQRGTGRRSPASFPCTGCWSNFCGRRRDSEMWTRWCSAARPSVFCGKSRAVLSGSASIIVSIPGLYHTPQDCAALMNRCLNNMQGARQYSHVAEEYPFKSSANKSVALAKNQRR